ncbi:MAG: protein kinase [Gammaproteobacteria bacterium]|nr:protein kinase [Gammaproteobacteria bacterium]
MEIPGYEIKRLIGQGGMATVYLAEQRSLGREVVLKILDTSTGISPETVERFLNEGRIIASLNHPHIITIYDIGQAGDQIFISMEYVEGGDLKDRLLNKVFAPVEAIDIVEKVAAGLAAAHDNGIVHRDVKPGNILFRRDGTPLLSDFGIAKRLTNDSDLTSTGMFVGSPNYMAPEQSESGPIDGRADIYSLGVILYEMLTGTRAYVADSVIDVILMHKKGPVPKLPAGLEQYQELLNLMMAKSRKDRFRDAESLQHFIAQMRRAGLVKSKAEMTARPDFDVTEEGATPSLGTTTTQLGAPERRLRPLQWVLLVLLVLCGIGWGVLLTIEHRLEPPPRAQPQMSTALPQRPAAEPAMAAGTAPEQVAQALLWLGRHCLNELKLTEPARDNAYYYFSRMLQIDPDNAEARAGMHDIAAHFAMLAEQAIAEDRFEQARSYIALGLQVDGDNRRLKEMRDIATEAKVGFWDALASLIRREQ